MYTRTSLRNGPPMADSADTGFPPSEQSHSPELQLQDGDYCQDYSAYSHYPPSAIATDFVQPSSELNTQPGSPLCLYQNSPSAHAFPCTSALDAMNMHDPSTVQPSQGHSYTEDGQAALPQFSAHQAWQSMNGYESLQVNQQCLRPDRAPQQIEHSRDGYLPEQEYNDDVYQQDAAYPEYSPQLLQQPYHTPSPYPDLQNAEPHDVPSGQAVWQQPLAGGSRQNIEFGHDGKLRGSWARLLLACLWEAENHEESLQEIYKWVLARTSKAGPSPGDGWKNSVRHNLSQNHAFKRVTRTHNGKKSGVWRLDLSKMDRGLRSTSEFRGKKGPTKSDKKGPPAPKRANAGAKGGQATREARHRRDCKSSLRQKSQRQQCLAQSPLPPRSQPYYAYPTPEHAISDNSIAATPTFDFDTPPAMTPGLTASPQTAWQTPQLQYAHPDDFTARLSELDLENGLHHRLPPTSDPTTRSQQPKEGTVAGQTGFAVDHVSHGILGGDGADSDEYSPLSHMSELGFAGGEGLQEMLSRELDEYGQRWGY